MKWTYGIQNKLAASGVLFLLCLLVLFSNYIDRNHTENVKNSISTLYEDRLIAEEYILKMTGYFYQVKEVINTDTNNTDKVNSINYLLLNIKKESDAYQKTKFTDAEKRKVDEFLNILNEFESIYLKNTQKKLDSANKAIAILKELSTIQLEESKQIMDHVETLYASGKASSQFVFAIIIVILLVLQALVFASKTLISHSKARSSHLN